jgi:hypothetical protein
VFPDRPSNAGTYLRHEFFARPAGGADRAERVQGLAVVVGVIVVNDERQGFA